MQWFHYGDFTHICLLTFILVFTSSFEEHEKRNLHSSFTTTFQITLLSSPGFCYFMLPLVFTWLCILSFLTSFSLLVFIMYVNIFLFINFLWCYLSFQQGNFNFSISYLIFFFSIPGLLSQFHEDSRSI